MDNEGSVAVDGVTGQDTTSEDAIESNEEQATREAKSKDEAPKEDSQRKEGDDKSQQVNKGETQDTQYTEKGTKLDPNPMSALNQQLANERRAKEQYEKVLTDPDTLVKYAKTMGLDLSKGEAKQIQQEQSIDPDKIETVEDLRAFAKQLQNEVKSKAEEFDKGLKGLSETQRTEAVASQIKDDITAVREKYPELNPKSDSYDPELDKNIGELFELADFDKENNRFIGKARLSDIADKVMSSRQKGVASGSKQAQTIVRERRQGQAVTGASEDLPDETQMTPSQVIASRMRQLSKS